MLIVRMVEKQSTRNHEYPSLSMGCYSPPLSRRSKSWKCLWSAIADSSVATIWASWDDLRRPPGRSVARCANGYRQWGIWYLTFKYLHFLHLIWCIYIYLFIYIYNGRAWFVEPYSNGTGSLWSMLLGTEHFSVAHGFSVSMWHITKSSMGFMFQVHALASKFFIFRRLHH